MTVTDIPDRYSEHWWREKYIVASEQYAHLVATIRDLEAQVKAAHHRIDDALKLWEEHLAKIGELQARVDKASQRFRELKELMVKLSVSAPGAEKDEKK